MNMDKDELIAILERMLAAELGAREGCKNLECIVGAHEELDRHVAACNRKASALVVVIELAKVHL
jgi:hypothetical protein